MKIIILAAALVLGAGSPQYAAAESGFSATRLGSGPLGALPNGFHLSTPAGLPDLWRSGWIGTPFAQRVEPFHVIGAVGRASRMERRQAAFAADILTREADENLPPEGIAAQANDTVNHADLITPAVGYRVAYAGRSVPISGDTRHDENLVEAAGGATLLIDEVIVPNPAMTGPPVARATIGHHTTPQEDGWLVAEVEQDLFDFTRETCDAWLLVGENGMTFEIMSNGVGRVG